MILVTGSGRARLDTFNEVLRLSHAVHRDCEDNVRLVFVERWTNMAALKTHFAVPASREFGKALAGLAAETPDLHVHDATEVRP